MIAFSLFVIVIIIEVVMGAATAAAFLHPNSYLFDTTVIRHAAFVSSSSSSSQRINSGLAPSSSFLRNVRGKQQQRRRTKRDRLCLFMANNKEEGFDFEELRNRIALSVHLGLMQEPKVVFIIKFNPNTKDEGIHAVEYPKGSENNFILAFESKSECVRFAQSLRKQFNFCDPTPEKVDLNRLQIFSDAQDVEVQVVPYGTELLPPKDTKIDITHHPHLSELRSNLDQVFELKLESIEDGVVFGGNRGDWE